MRVLHLLPTNMFSGAENVVCQIINLFKSKSNVEMIYCSLDGQIREVLEEKGISFYPLDGFSKKAVKKAIGDLKPDLIHAHDMQASYIAARVCGRIPLISHIHNNNYNSRGLTIKSLAFFLAAQKARHIFWVSKSSFKGYFFHRFFKKKSSVLCNIIDINELKESAALDKNEYNYDIVYLGRLSYQKNPYKLLDICEILKDENDRISIAIIGTGEMEREIVESATQRGLLSNVTFLGYQPNPFKILASSKVMIMTSLWEGTPMCALEAQAFGIPIVCTPVDGLTDLVIDGYNGFFADDNKLFADKVRRLLADDNLWLCFSSRQIERAIEWNDTDRYYGRINEVYRKNGFVI